MKKLQPWISMALAAWAAVGCSDIGNAPPGMSEEEAKAAIERMSPEDKIRAIASSPMPPQEKEKKFKEIEEQTGVKASDVLAPRPATGMGR
ncbi:MAG: hypothetical protein N2109_07550 [Fimbriimonadales bacterium]|nr:hypothetical protein [Fimbriimonadales bacterium]